MFRSREIIKTKADVIDALRHFIAQKIVRFDSVPIERFPTAVSCAKLSPAIAFQFDIPSGVYIGRFKTSDVVLFSTGGKAVIPASGVNVETMCMLPDTWINLIGVTSVSMIAPYGAFVSLQCVQGE